MIFIWFYLQQLLAVLCVVDTLFLITNAFACGSAFGVDKGKYFRKYEPQTFF